MEYKIGDLARTLGMPVNAIRFYEKYGIISPDRSQDSNFRIYNELDLYRLQFAKYFRSMDFSLEQTAEMVGRFTRAEQYEALEQQLEQVRAEQERLQRVESCIRTELANMRFADDTREECRIVTLPAMYWLFSHTEKRDFPSDEVDAALTEKVMTLLPDLYRYCLVEREELAQTESGPLACRWGLAFEEKYAGRFEPWELAQMVCLPQRRYVTRTSQVDQDCIILKEFFTHQLTLCKEQGLAVGENAIAALQLGQFVAPDRTRTPMVCYLPIEE